MDEFFAMVVVAGSIFLSVAGLTHLVMDFRHFDDIAKQCAEQGYIQNEKIRIMCSKEK